jgi:hypothetical protein
MLFLYLSIPNNMKPDDMIKSIIVDDERALDVLEIHDYNKTPDKMNLFETSVKVWDISTSFLTRVQ